MYVSLFWAEVVEVILLFCVSRKKEHANTIPCFPQPKNSIFLSLPSLFFFSFPHNVKCIGMCSLRGGVLGVFLGIDLRLHGGVVLFFRSFGWGNCLEIGD